MDTNKKYLLFIVIILIVLPVFFVFGKNIIGWLKKEAIKPASEEMKLLKLVFPSQIINSQFNSNYYVIDNKDYYVKKIGDLNKDNLNEFVIMELIKGEKRILNFYSVDFLSTKIHLLIDNIDDFEWYSENEEYKGKEIEVLLKDITGDDISEIFVPYERNAKNNRWYQILIFDKNDKKLIKMSEKNPQEKQTEIIDFDEIAREGDFVVTAWHGTWSRGKLYYSVEGNILNFEKSVGAYGNPDIEGEYEYREIDKNENVVYKETRQGSVWTDSLSRQK